mmetsp:Transcript_16528/g.32617  ORF Transcript_16528/g.32617 Transcript_16528/m.32617 type:complete len:212 (+) Transcript_16528:54-689(+)
MSGAGRESRKRPASLPAERILGAEDATSNQRTLGSEPERNSSGGGSSSGTMSAPSRSWSSGTRWPDREVTPIVEDIDSGYEASLSSNAPNSSRSTEGSSREAPLRRRAPRREERDLEPVSESTTKKARLEATEKRSRSSVRSSGYHAPPISEPAGVSESTGVEGLDSLGSLVTRGRVGSWRGAAGGSSPARQEDTHQLRDAPPGQPKGRRR